MNLQDKVKNFLQNAGQVVNNFSHGAQQAAAPIAHNIQQGVNMVGNEIQQLPQQTATFGQNLVNNYTPFANPTSNNGNNFWSSPTASIMAGQTQLPQFDLTGLANNVQNPVLKFGAQAGLGMADSLLNTPRNLVQAPINIARDVNTGQTQPRQLLADAAPFAEGMLNVGTLGGGTIAKGIAEQGLKEGIMQGAKEGLLQGGKYGAAYGALGGLESGKNITDPTQYAANLAVNTGMGALGGAALGGVTGGVTGVPRSVVANTIEKMFPKDAPEQVAKKTDQYLARTFTRDGMGQFAKADATPFVPAGRDYATPKQPLKVTDWMDKVDQQIKDSIPQPGLSVKAVDSRELGLKDQILNQPPEPARMSQKALDEGLLAPKSGRDISVSPQAEQRYKVNTKTQLDNLNNIDPLALKQLTTKPITPSKSLSDQELAMQQLTNSRKQIIDNPERTNQELAMKSLNATRKFSGPGTDRVPTDSELALKQLTTKRTLPADENFPETLLSQDKPLTDSELASQQLKNQQNNFISNAPTKQEQASMQEFNKMLKAPSESQPEPKLLGKSPTLLENPPTGEPPQHPGYTLGEASANPKEVAQQARLASFAQKQSLQVRGGTLAQEMDTVLKTPKDNLNIRLAVENPAMIDKYASKAQNPDAFAALAHKIINFYSYSLQTAKGQKVPLNQVHDYFTHVWDLSTPEAQKIYDDLMAKNAKNFTSGFTKQRVVNTIEEGLGKGLELAHAKASDDIIDYTKSMSKQMSNAAFNNKINELRPGGAVPFAENGTVPYNHEGQVFEQSNKPGNKATFIDPEIQKYMGYYNKSALADNPVISTMDKINTGIKELKLAGGFFHGLRESVNYAGQQLMSGHIPDLAGGARAFWDTGFARDQMDGFIKDGTLDAASKMGIDVTSAGGIGDEKTGPLELMRSKDAIKKATFQRLIPYYIMKTVNNLPESSRTPAVGKQIMALYNGLTSEVAGTNKTASQLARFTFLAPQFNLGKIINVVSAFKPENTPQANFARQALIGTAIATAIEYEIANYVANQKIDMDPKSILSNGILHPNISLPYKSPTGKALAADLPASNLADLYKTGAGSLAKAGVDLFTGKGDQVGNDLTQAGTDASHALTSRTSSIFSLANQLQSGKDYYGNPVNIGNLAQSQLPIPVVQGLKTLQNNPKTGQPSQDVRTALLNTAGLRVHNDQNDPTVQAQTAYFNGLNKVANSLNANDKQIFLGELHPTTKDANGNSIVDKNVYTTPAKYDVLLGNKNLLSAEQTFQQAQKSHDPMWDLNSQQLRAFMQANVISKNNPTSGFKTGDTTVKTLYSTLPQSFFTQRQQWMQSLPASTTASQGPQAPQMPPEVSQFWNSYSSLPYGTGARTKALQSSVGQEALAFINQQQTYTNQQRADMGLPLLASTSTTSGTGSSGGGSTARISAQRRISNASARRMFKVGSGSNKIPFAKFGGMKAPRITGVSAKAISLSTTKKSKKLALNGKPLRLKS